MSRPTALALALLLLAAPDASGAPSRERAIEQIPELMGRILESQEEIRERESEMAPVVERYDRKLAEAQRQVEGSSSEDEAAEALVDYVEAYASRLEAQEQALRAMESAIVRMRADARELTRAAQLASAGREASPAERRAFFEEHFQGVAAATAELAERLQRQHEAATAGAVLNASWASHDTRDLPLSELGPEGAVRFARQVEGLYARFRARSNQIRSERRAVRQLLDILIERQLARRLDTLFADGGGLGALLSGEGRSADWQDLGDVVSRALGLPTAGGDAFRPDAPSLNRLDHFARGGHRR